MKRMKWRACVNVAFTVKDCDPPWKSLFSSVLKEQGRTHTKKVGIYKIVVPYVVIWVLKANQLVIS